jgi:hypothetical protein
MLKGCRGESDLGGENAPGIGAGDGVGAGEGWTDCPAGGGGLKF